MSFGEEITFQLNISKPIDCIRNENWNYSNGFRF